MKKLGIVPAKSEVAFEFDENDRCYLKKVRGKGPTSSRFRRAHKAGKLRMSTEEIMALTRGG